MLNRDASIEHDAGCDTGQVSPLSCITAQTMEPALLFTMPRHCPDNAYTWVQTPAPGFPPDLETSQTPRPGRSAYRSTLRR
jgi:hypothetical protein